MLQGEREIGGRVPRWFPIRSHVDLTCMGGLLKDALMALVGVRKATSLPLSHNPLDSAVIWRPLWHAVQSALCFSFSILIESLQLVR